MHMHMYVCVSDLYLLIHSPIIVYICLVMHIHLALYNMYIYIYIYIYVFHNCLFFVFIVVNHSLYLPNYAYSFVV